MNIIGQKRPSAETGMQSSASNHSLDPRYLIANDEVYRRLVARVTSARKTESIFDAVVNVASFASKYHPGRFADGEIENVLHRFAVDGRSVKISKERLDDERRNSRRRVLHLTTALSAVGGHTRLIHRWVHLDNESCHSIIVTDQKSEPIPAWMERQVSAQRGRITVLPGSASRVQKAAVVAETASNVEFVFVHHFAEDVVPILAFANSDGPPVGIINHADHAFWLGSSIADFVVSHRAKGSDNARNRRFSRRNMVLPILVNETSEGNLKPNARQEIGIPDGQIVLLTIARPEKYRPAFGKYDFLSTVGRILDNNPRAHAYLVGTSADAIEPHINKATHDRIHFMGNLEDPKLFLQAADVYLEPFPFGTSTAVLEAAALGLPAVCAYSPLSPLLVSNHDSLSDLCRAPVNEQDYISEASRLIGDRHCREYLGEAMRLRVSQHHLGLGWLDHLRKMYQTVEGLSHSTVKLPTSPCLGTDEDIGLASWHAPAIRRAEIEDSRDGELNVLRHQVGMSRRIGDYARATAYALRVLKQLPFDRSSWWLMGATLLGPHASAVRRGARGLKLKRIPKTPQKIGSS